MSTHESMEGQAVQDARSADPARPKTQSQLRAQAALAQVQAMAKNLEQQSRFRAYAQSLPAMIQMNGLGQAAAFCRSRSDSGSNAAYRRHYEVLSSWLTAPGQVYANEQGAELLEMIASSGMAEYRAAQREALAFLDWIKRFSAAFLETRKELEQSLPADGTRDEAADA